jgi:UDP-N-acetyl-D-glucosamine dehydrogenase
LNGSTIFAVGVAYKRDANDARESAALDVVRGLADKGALVSYSDPYISTIQINGRTMQSLPLCPEVLAGSDCTVILTDHSAFDYAMIAGQSRLVLDCRNALRNFTAPNVMFL